MIENYQSKMTNYLTINTDVFKQRKVVIVDESNPRCNIGADIASLLVQKAFKSLKSPIKIVSPPHTPVPVSPDLEDAYLPNVEKIKKSVKEICKKN